jgi:hypothetical protein
MFAFAKEHGMHLECVAVHVFFNVMNRTEQLIGGGDSCNGFGSA